MTSYKNALIYHDFDFARGLLLCSGWYSSSIVAGASHRIPSLNPATRVAEKIWGISSCDGQRSRHLSVAIVKALAIDGFIVDTAQPFNECKKIPSKEGCPEGGVGFDVTL
jgi:hypothetical protein